MFRRPPTRRDLLILFALVAGSPIDSVRSCQTRDEAVADLRAALELLAAIS